MEDYRRATQFKLFSCQHHYDLLLDFASKGNMKSQDNRNAIYAQVEAVVFTAMSMLDVLAQEINSSLKLQMNEKKVSIFSVKKQLGKDNSEKAKRIFSLLDGFMNTTLFIIMNKLRNYITHRSIIDGLTIEIYPPLSLFPDISSKIAKKTFVVDKQVIRVDKSFETEFKIEPLPEKGYSEDLPDEYGELRFLLWKGYPLLEMVGTIFDKTWHFTEKVEKELDNHD